MIYVMIGDATLSAWLTLLLHIIAILLYIISHRASHNEVKIKYIIYNKYINTEIYERERTTPNK